MGGMAPPRGVLQEEDIDFSQKGKIQRRCSSLACIGKERNLSDGRPPRHRNAEKPAFPCILLAKAADMQAMNIFPLQAV
jgi:hypothetical protein